MSVGVGGDEPTSPERATTIYAPDCGAVRAAGETTESIHLAHFCGRREVHGRVKMTRSVNLRNHAMDEDARRLAFDVSSYTTSASVDICSPVNAFRVRTIPIIAPQKAL